MPCSEGEQTLLSIIGKGSSQTKARTRDPCIGRQILNHCTTREAPKLAFLSVIFVYFLGTRDAVRLPFYQT